MRLGLAALAVVWCLLPLGMRAAATESIPPETLTIVLVGDTGLNANAQPTRPDGLVKWGHFLTWAQATEHIANQIDGDLNIMNIETVVSDNNSLVPGDKGQAHPFFFKTHPQGVRHLVKIGFNVAGIANNHTMDYGVPGLRQSLEHLSKLHDDGLLDFAGAGLNRETASRPAVLRVKGTDVLFSSIGIATNSNPAHRALDRRPGQMAYRHAKDFDEVVARLKEAKGDFRVLSIHYGKEMSVKVDDLQRRDWRRRAVGISGIDLVVGHHAHVVRPVEINGDAIIFYGLGNFLHHGTAQIAKFGICRDYGLLARVHLLQAENGKVVPAAVEVLPLTDTHMKTRPFGDVRQAHTRIHVLNELAATLDEPAQGARGMRFTPQADGTGLYCFPGASENPGPIGALCRDWRPAPKPSGALSRSIQAACGPIKRPFRERQRQRSWSWPR